MTRENNRIRLVKGNMAPLPDHHPPPVALVTPSPAISATRIDPTLARLRRIWLMAPAMPLVGILWQVCGIPVVEPVPDQVIYERLDKFVKEHC